jgi:hypothetical protein
MHSRHDFLDDLKKYKLGAMISSREGLSCLKVVKSCWKELINSNLSWDSMVRGESDSV